MSSDLRSSAARNALFSAAVLASASVTPAAILYWAPTGNPAGGTGTWDTSALKWSTVSTTPASLVAWNNSGQDGTNPDLALFGTTSGTVTLNTNVTVGGLAFNSQTTYPTNNSSGTYTINGTGTITMAGSTLNTGHYHNGSATTINVSLAGTNGLLISNSGRNDNFLILAGDNSNLSGAIYACGRTDEADYDGGRAPLVAKSSTALGVNDNSVANKVMLSPSLGSYGALTLNGSSGALTINKYIEIGRAGTISSLGGNNVSNGTWLIGTWGSTYVNVAPNTTFTQNGAVSGGATLNKTNTGTLRLGGTITTPVSIASGGGTLIMNGAATYNLYYTQAVQPSGTTVAGTGSFNNNHWASDQFQMNGTISPGDGDLASSGIAGLGSAGTLTFKGGKLALSSTSMLAFDLDATAAGSSDLINDLVDPAIGPTSGALVLNGTLRINALTGTLQNGGLYRLINYTAGQLTGSGLSVDVANSTPGYTYVVDIGTPGQINLLVTAVPEPAVLAMLALGALGLMRRRRH